MNGGSKNGLVKRESIPTATYAPSTSRDDKHFSGDATWGAIEPEDLGTFISRLTNCGAWVSFAVSSDRGVVLVTVQYAGRRWRAAPRSGEQIQQALDEILGEVEDCWRRVTGG